MINHRWCNASIISFVYNLPPWTWDSYHKIVIIIVYIPLQASPTAAIGALAAQITAVENANPDSFVLILGDFNHITLSRDLPKYKQHVKCATREGKTLNHMDNHQRCISRGTTWASWLLRARRGLPPAIISPETEKSVILRSQYQVLGPWVHCTSPRRFSMYGLAGALVKKKNKMLILLPLNKYMNSIIIRW